MKKSSLLLISALLTGCGGRVNHGLNQHNSFDIYQEFVNGCIEQNNRNKDIAEEAYIFDTTGFTNVRNKQFAISGTDICTKEDEEKDPNYHYFSNRGYAEGGYTCLPLMYYQDGQQVIGDNISYVIRFFKVNNKDIAISSNDIHYEEYDSDKHFAYLRINDDDICYVANCKNEYVFSIIIPSLSDKEEMHKHEDKFPGINIDEVYEDVELLIDNVMKACKYAIDNNAFAKTLIE